ncbi:uncharacterized protein PAC_11571 [Phialocephala subalpina]|uniref:Uncharacterized protein n=1 Tax=Phialocephala subalpina TaxID=576137 RepID=A0A1L7X9H5_9HELO|nr:uncharacterized protein PAC_11571 [Phialocephala subalpina]
MAIAAYSPGNIQHQLEAAPVYKPVPLTFSENNNDNELARIDWSLSPAIDDPDFLFAFRNLGRNKDPRWGPFGLCQVWGRAPGEFWRNYYDNTRVYDRLRANDFGRGDPEQAATWPQEFGQYEEPNDINDAFAELAACVIGSGRF